MSLEGFAKLLMCGWMFEGRTAILSKMLVAYFSSDAADQSSSRQREKSLLCSFFDVFTAASAKHVAELVGLFVPTARYLLDKSDCSKCNVRSMANYVYYTVCSRERFSLDILSALLAQVTAHVHNFNRMQKWIDILLEFNVHQANVRCACEQLQAQDFDQLCLIVDAMQQILVGDFPLFHFGLFDRVDISNANAM